MKAFKGGRDVQVHLGQIPATRSPKSSQAHSAAGAPMGVGALRPGLVREDSKGLSCGFPRKKYARYNKLLKLEL